MAAADYRLCDLCESKAFYDANLGYERDHEVPRIAGRKVPQFVGCKDASHSDRSSHSGRVDGVLNRRRKHPSDR